MAKREESDGAAVRVTCPSCAVHTSCFGQGAGARALEQLDAVVERRFGVRAGEYLYHIGDPFKSLYAIRSGCLKNSLRDDQGREHVMGFHMAGDVVGVGGIGRDAYVFDVCALEPSDVCEVPLKGLEDLARDVPALGRNILKMFGRYRNRDAGSHALRRSESAETRLAGFLLEFSRRLAARGRDPASFSLPMSDEDIASYLGLGMGEVDAAFALLGAHAIVNRSGKTIRISSIEGLQSLAAGLSGHA
jgi:CRP/FNR family transcriptional regulator